MGTREQENGKRKAAAKSCQSLDTWVSKVPCQEPLDADNVLIRYHALRFSRYTHAGWSAGLF